jgi:hypothetical protein
MVDPLLSTKKQYFKRTLMMKNAFLRGWICVFAKKVVPLQALNACAKTCVTRDIVAQ